ncbi:MAG: WSD1 family O-acyltransferase, partial [Congregibacter sp.]|nr:WSD1 family O-acyltransferase [Congregibacter sp.]
DIACAKERMLAICEETRSSKAYVNAIGARTMLEYGQFTPASLAAAGAKVAAEQGLANVMDPAFNTVTTNVPGPPIPLYSNGAKMVGIFGLGIVQDFVGLFHTINSYCDVATISITCCREMMPDPAHYADLLRASLRDLEQAFLPAPDDGQVPESIPVKAKRAATATAKPKAKPAPAQATAKQSAVKAKQPKQVAVKAAAKPAS